MNKKQILTGCLLVSLAATAIGGTLAYFTDSEQATNEYTIGNVKIDLYEDVAHKNALDAVVNNETTDDLGKGSDESTEFKYTSIMPGDTMEKVATVENDGANTAYVALVIKNENYLNFNRNIDDYYEGQGYDAVAMQEVTDDIWSGEGWGLQYAKDDDHIVRYMMVDSHGTATEGASVLGYGYANHSIDADGEYYNYAGEYFTNGTRIREDADDGNFMSITELHDRIWVVYLELEAGASYTIDLTTTCPDYIDNNSINAFENMALDIKAFAIQEQGLEAGDAFAELFKAGFDY